MINLGKTFIKFSGNTHPSVQSDVKEALHVAAVNNVGLYLGVPVDL